MPKIKKSGNKSSSINRVDDCRPGNQHHDWEEQTLDTENYNHSSNVNDIPSTQCSEKEAFLEDFMEKFRPFLNENSDGPLHEDEYDSEENMYIELPEVVTQEFDYRNELLRKYKGDKTRLPPPKPHVIQALRDHYKAGKFDPTSHGGALSVLEHLGATVKSTDPMVKDLDVNVFSLMIRSNEEEEREEMEKLVATHRGEVRLLRYKEFVQDMTTGETPLDLTNCFFLSEDEENEAYPDDYDYGPDIETDYDKDQLELLELTPIAQAFTLEFFRYCNSDKVNLGIASGVEKAKLTKDQIRMAERALPQGMKFISIDCSINTMIEQCKELETRYREQKRPLGGVNNNTKEKTMKSKGKNKKKKKKPGQSTKGAKSHAAEIEIHVTSLFQTLVKVIKRPSLDFGYFITALTSMLTKATVADPDIARAICSGAGTHIIKLRNTALKFAKDSDSGAITTSKEVADMWWSCYYCLGSILGFATRDLSHEIESGKERSGKDIILAAEFFEAKIIPEITRNIKSESSAEIAGGYQLLSRSMKALSDDVTLNFIRNEDIWRTIESMCNIDMDTYMNGREFKSIRERARCQFYLSVAADEALQLVCKLCCESFDFEQGNKDNMEPQPLAHSLVYQGVVPLLMTCAKSKFKRMHTTAMQGLAQMSRVKECREILFQRKDTIGVMHEMFKSNDGDTASATMLLAAHLLWDEEWHDPIMKIGPPIENTCLKWATYAMKCLCDEADKNRSKREAMFDLNDDIESFHKYYEIKKKVKQKVTITDDEEKILLEYEDNTNQMANQLHCGDFDKGTHVYGSTEHALSRPLLLMSTMCRHRDAPHRLRKHYFFRLAASCLDSPNRDICGSAIAFLSNYNTGKYTHGHSVPGPEYWPDPDHILDSISYQIDRKMASNEWGKSMQDLLYIRFVNDLSNERSWKPYFKKLPIFSTLNVVACMDLSNGDKDSSFEQSVDEEERLTYNKGCNTASGLLGHCSACGKIEEKEGQLQTCSRCKSVKYCSKECQVSHWKKTHRHECASLAAFK